MDNHPIQRAKEVLQSCNLEKLERSGIRKERISSGTSHIIVTYPPYKACKRLIPEAIFNESKRVRRSVSLYVHIPFCVRRCKYCHYITYQGEALSATWRYLTYLKKELGLLLRIPELQNLNVRSLHIGGGTPTYLNVAQLSNLMNILGTQLHIKSGTEVTFESCPETIVSRNGKEKLAVLIDRGVNRLSIGMQSLDDRVLETAGRSHSSDDAFRAFELAKEAGFRNINVDLMIGLPDQTLQTWNETIERLHMLMPESVTVYDLRLKSAPMHIMLRKQPERFPSIEHVLMMNIMVREFFMDLGYRENPLHWLNKSTEYLYDHQRQKWQHETELLGLGVSSYSFMNNVQYFNCHKLEDYYFALDAVRLPIGRGAILDEREQIIRKIIFGLRMAKGIEKGKYYSLYSSEFDRLRELGLLNIDDRIRLTQPQGYIFAEEVCRRFYSKQFIGSS